MSAFVKLGLYYPIMVCCCLEVALRILGYAHFKNNDYSIEAVPKNAFLGHPQLGIQLQEGKYRITVNKKLTFEATHLANNARRVASNAQGAPPNVLLLGCSFTYGFGVDDSVNFASLLQQEFPKWSIQNSGVVGYGTVQSLLQLKEMAAQQHWKAVVLNFSSFHFMRNVLSQQYRSNLKIGYGRSSEQVNNNMNQARFPYKAHCADSIAYAPWAAVYENWPGREWLASVNWVQTSYDYFKEDTDAQIEATVCLLEEMQAICEVNGIRFGVACLDATAETAALRKQIPNIPWCNVGFDFGNKQATNYPYDSHPNAVGHQQIARAIAPFLKQLLHEK